MTDRLKRLELATMSRHDRTSLLRRSAVPDGDVRRIATEICDDVAARGDVAVREYGERFGGGFRKVTDAELDAAVAGLETEVIEAIEAAASNVRAYHTAQIPQDLDFETICTFVGEEYSGQKLPVANTRLQKNLKKILWKFTGTRG